MSEADILNTNLFSVWLHRGDPLPEYSTFTHVPLLEQLEVRGDIENALIHKIFIYHNDPEEFREVLEKWGYSQTIAAINKRPSVDKTRKGNFGEILACEYLREIENYEVPVYRFRWNPNPDMSMRGEDALAFKFSDSDEEQDIVCVVESKVQGTFNRTKVDEAIQDQLRDRRYVCSIKFVFSVLRKNGDSQKADAVLEFLNASSFKPHSRKDFFMLITGTNPQRDPFDRVRQLNLNQTELIAAHLFLSDLEQFISQLFKADINVDFI